MWITGASQGLGEALALHLASLGARVILSSRRPETLLRVCEACVVAGAGDARALALDARAGSAAMRAKGEEALALAEEMHGWDRFDIACPISDDATGSLSNL